MRITVFHAAKILVICPDTLALGQMHAAMRATHHIFGCADPVLPGRILAVGPEQQINHCHDGQQKQQTAHSNNLRVKHQDQVPRPE